MHTRISATLILGLLTLAPGLQSPGWAETAYVPYARCGQGGTQVDVSTWLDDPPAQLEAGNCLVPPTGDVETGYAYAWKIFLYLMGQNNDTYRFLDFGDSLKLFPAHGAPGPFQGAGSANAGRSGKHFTLNEFRQAAALVPEIDENGRWLHYSVMTNEPEWNYIRKNMLYTLDGYNAKGCSALCTTPGSCGSDPDYLSCIHGKTCVSLDPGSSCTKGALPIQLPDDSIELKIAWRVLETCDLPDSPPNCKPDKTLLDELILARDATVDPYGPGKLNKAVDGVTLGLVGIHILSKTPANLDWVWTSFEYVGNADPCPSPKPEKGNMFCPPEPIPLSVWSGQLVNLYAAYDKKSNPYIPQKALSLAAKTPADVILTPDQKSLVCTSLPDNFKFAHPPLYQATGNQKLAPTEVCRENKIPAGVKSFNQGIWQQLAYADPKLQNYMLIGAFWFNDNCRTDIHCKAVGAPLKMKTSHTLVDTSLSNTTMETYEQYLGPLFQSFGSRDQGCTICHGINQFNPNPMPSHFYGEALADRSFIFQRIRQ